MDTLASNPPPADLEQMASYILYGKDENGQNGAQRGELTNSGTRYSSFKLKEDKNASLEQLIEAQNFPSNNLSIRHSRDIYVQKRLTIKRPRIDKKTGEVLDPGDSDIPGMVELWESIDRISHLIKVLEGEAAPREDENLFDSSYRLYRLKHTKIEMCRDQYFLKEMCKPAIHWPEADRPGPQYYDWTADSFYWISEEEWRAKIENSYTSRISHNLQDYETRTNEVTGQLEVKWVVRRHTFDWTNEKHVRAFMSCWQSIYDAMFDHLDTYGYTLLLDFDRYREMAHLSPDRDFLLQCRIKQVPYPTMMRELQEKLGVSYKESNIAVIVNKEIPKKIAKAALRHALLIDTPQEERKQCFHCKQWLPRHDIFFAHNVTRKDGLSSNCKECERIMRQQRKEQQDKWIKAAVEANAREHASVASKPNP